MQFDIITIFPQIFKSYFSESILKRAQKKNLIKINLHNLRDYTSDKHQTVDDRPYGGGVGMILKVEPIFKALAAIKSLKHKNKKTLKQKTRVIIFSAKGKRFTQKEARRLAKKYEQLILICGRYEGVDERVAQHLADEEISIGDYVLTGGELPAMIMVDTVSRLLLGVLGKKQSLKQESFTKKYHLEYPQYTRPENFKKWKVPMVLLSGNHQKIEQWKINNSQLMHRAKKLDKV